MSQSERDAVVELLRCAADNGDDASIGLVGMFKSADDLDLMQVDRVVITAWHINDIVRRERGFIEHVEGAPVDENYRHQLLEAAARVEEGSWP